MPCLGAVKISAGIELPPSGLHPKSSPLITTTNVHGLTVGLAFICWAHADLTTPLKR